MTRGHKWLLAAALTVAAAALLAYYQGKAFLEERIKAELAARGVAGLEFTLAAVGPRRIVLEQIAYGPVTLESLALDYALRQRSGSWEARGLRLADAPLAMPPLEGRGPLAWREGAGSLSGTLASQDTAWMAAFDLAYPASLTVNKLHFPWNGGKVSTQDVTIPLSGDAPLTVPVTLRRVSLNALLHQVTGGRAAATGAVSGSVPVRIARDGNFTLLPGTLKADRKGTLILSPELVPGDNPQVELVREVMKNFHYSDFSLTVGSTDDKLSMLLSLSGNNPDAYNGREVKLNVRLSGDVIELVRSSLLPLADPQTLLEQSEDAKK